MSCFPCFRRQNSKKEQVPVAEPRELSPSPPPPATAAEPAAAPAPATPPKPSPEPEAHKKEVETSPVKAENANGGAKTFTFRELASATKNFRQELLGEGVFGRVFKATLPGSGQVAAIKQLDRSGTQGSKEFLVEVMMLSLLHHPNLVQLIGYCADGDQRILVYDYMPSGSLEDHLFENSKDRKPLSWTARMKIASGIAQGLEYLHEKANPPIIYRDLKSSKIFLDGELNPKLSDYGLAKLVHGGNKMHTSASGYCAPEYERHGELTPKSDVYSFGVVLLELITGRRALDTSKPADEQDLVAWAQPIFRDPKRYPEMADPLLRKDFPVTSLNQAVGVAAMCLQEEPSVRPLVSDMVAALSFLTVAPPNAALPRILSVALSLSHAGSSNELGGQKHDKSGELSIKSSSSKHKDGDEEDGSSSSEYESSSEGSDQDEKKADKSQNKSKKTVSWSSSKKRKSKGKSRDSGSPSSSRSGSDDESVGSSSLRSTSDVHEGGHTANAEHDTMHDENEDEYSDESAGSSPRYHDGNDSMNHRQETEGRSDSIYSRHSSHVGSEDGHGSEEE